jgi:hypothetical protein
MNAATAAANAAAAARYEEMTAEFGADRDLFEQITAADRTAQAVRNLAAHGVDSATRRRNEQDYPGRNAAFLALLDSLTAEQMPRYLAYRKVMRGLG